VSGEEKWSLKWEVVYLSGEEISKVFLMQLAHVSLGETLDATLGKKHVHEEHHKDATVMPIALYKHIDSN